MKSTTLDLFTLTHLFLWIIIGNLFPNRYDLALFVGILWEFFEKYLVYNKSLYNHVKNNWPVPERYWNEVGTNSFIDICVNMLGYYIGSNLHLTIKKLL